MARTQILSALMAASMASAALAQSPNLTILPGGMLRGLSPDGQFAIGTSGSAVAQRWSATDGFINAGPSAAGAQSLPTGISADGSVVTGTYTYFAGGTQHVDIYRWTAGGAGGSVIIGQSSAGGIMPSISRDGSTIIYQGANGKAFRWTAALGSVQLPDLPIPTVDMLPTALSADGSVIAGSAYAPQNALQGFVWTAETGSLGLGWLPGSTLESGATAMSADSSRIFGYVSLGTLSIESVYWDAARQIHPMHTPDDTLQIFSVNGAGTTALGIGFPKSYVWQEDAGWAPLAPLLQSDFGVNLAYESPIQAWGISDDDRTLAGWGTVNATPSREAWVVHLPTGLRVAPACYANCDNSAAAPVLNVADFTCFLGKFAAGVPYANCDGSTQPPVLNIADFGCFLQKVAAGCP